MEKLQTLFGNLNVYINRLPAPEENIFHVSFVDKQNKTHSILMHYDSERWAFCHREQIPMWVTELENPLGDLISKEMVQDRRSRTGIDSGRASE